MPAIVFTVDGENVKIESVNPEAIRNWIMCYCDELPYGIIPPSSFINTEKINIVSCCDDYAIDNDDYATDYDNIDNIKIIMCSQLSKAESAFKWNSTLITTQHCMLSHALLDFYLH